MRDLHDENSEDTRVPWSEPDKEEDTTEDNQDRCFFVSGVFFVMLVMSCHAKCDPVEVQHQR